MQIGGSTAEAASPVSLCDVVDFGGSCGSAPLNGPAGWHYERALGRRCRVPTGGLWTT